MINLGLRRQVCGVADLAHGAVRAVDVVDDGRRGHDESEVVLALKPLLYDVHVQESEEAAAEAEAERDGSLGFKDERSVIELELFERFTQIVIVLAVLGVKPAKDHRRHAAVAGQSLGGGALRARHGVADAHVAHILQCTRNEPDLACAKCARIHGLRAETPDVRHLKGLARRHEL